MHGAGVKCPYTLLSGVAYANVSTDRSKLPRQCGSTLRERVLLGFTIAGPVMGALVLTLCVLELRRWMSMRSTVKQLFGTTGDQQVTTHSSAAKSRSSVKSPVKREGGVRVSSAVVPDSTASSRDIDRGSTRRPHSRVTVGQTSPRRRLVCAKDLSGSSNGSTSTPNLKLQTRLSTRQNVRSPLASAARSTSQLTFHADLGGQTPKAEEAATGSRDAAVAPELQRSPSPTGTLHVESEVTDLAPLSVVSELPE